MVLQRLEVGLPVSKHEQITLFIHECLHYMPNNIIYNPIHNIKYAVVGIDCLEKNQSSIHYNIEVLTTQVLTYKPETKN